MLGIGLEIGILSQLVCQDWVSTDSGFSAWGISLVCMFTSYKTEFPGFLSIKSQKYDPLTPYIKSTKF